MVGAIGASKVFIALPGFCLPNRVPLLCFRGVCQPAIDSLWPLGSIGDLADNVLGQLQL